MALLGFLFLPDYLYFQTISPEIIMIFFGNRRKVVVFFLLSAALLTPLLSGCSKKETETKEELIRPVRYLIAQPDSNVRLYRYPGTARSKVE